MNVEFLVADLVNNCSTVVYGIIQGVRWAEDSDVSISNPWTQQTRQDCDVQANWVPHQHTVSREIQGNKITRMKYTLCWASWVSGDSIKPKGHAEWVTNKMNKLVQDGGGGERQICGREGFARMVRRLVRRVVGIYYIREKITRIRWCLWNI